MADAPGFSIMGPGPLPQAVSGAVLVILLYLSISMGEFLYNSFTGMWKNRVELFPNTYPSGVQMFTAIQNPTNPKAKTIHFSDNQRSGIEFSYAMFIYIKSSTFSEGNKQLYHILHKGYSQVYPLLGPGIFCRGDKNTLRIYMNCFDTWNNYSEIDNIPVDKWFHLVVSCKGNTLYGYINGNLKIKMPTSNLTPPYQNYGNVYAFSSRKITLRSTIPSLTTTTSEDVGQGLTFAGSATGMISRVYYFGYALTYTEIQALMNMGPSTVMSGPDMSISPYLADTWWENNGTMLS